MKNLQRKFFKRTCRTRLRWCLWKTLTKYSAKTYSRMPSLQLPLKSRNRTKGCQRCLWLSNLVASKGSWSSLVWSRLTMTRWKMPAQSWMLFLLFNVRPTLLLKNRPMESSLRTLWVMWQNSVPKSLPRWKSGMTTITQFNLMTSQSTTRSISLKTSTKILSRSLTSMNSSAASKLEKVMFWIHNGLRSRRRRSLCSRS